MSPYQYPPRQWEIDDLFDLGRREGEKTKYLKAIPVLILEKWVRDGRKGEVSNYIRTKWAKYRLESSGLHETFLPKSSSNIVAAISAIQSSRNLTPPLVTYKGNGIFWVNLPFYEQLLQDYRQKYCSQFIDDYKRLFPSQNDEPEWITDENIVNNVWSLETQSKTEENIGVTTIGIDLVETNPKYLKNFQVLEEYEKCWQGRLEIAERRANAAEQEIILLNEKLERSQAELKETVEKLLKNNFPETMNYIRSRIPEHVRIEVWRRDDGKCARCGSRENLEYDHIVPVSKGGGNTTRNIELLCERCNRSKGNRT